MSFLSFFSLERLSPIVLLSFFSKTDSVGDKKTLFFSFFFYFNAALLFFVHNILGGFEGLCLPGWKSGWSLT